MGDSDENRLLLPALRPLDPVFAFILFGLNLNMPEEIVE